MALASDIIALVRALLVDPNKKSWADDVLLGFENEALDALARDVPATAAVTEDLQLVAGCRQTLPAGGLAINTVHNAVKADGSYDGAVTSFDLKSMQLGSPDWQSHTAGAVRQWSPDPMDPKVFWVYPPQPAVPLKAKVEYVKAPVTLALGDTVPTPAAYDSAIIEFMLFRAYSMDAEYSGENGRAMFHKAGYERVIGNGESG